MVRRGLFITAHAITRYRERVEPCCDEEIARRLSSDAILCAARFGARFVRLPGGQLVVISEGAIVTVLPAHAREHTHRTPSKLRGRAPERSRDIRLVHPGALQ